MVKTGIVLVLASPKEIDQITEQITRADSLFEKAKKSSYQIGTQVLQHAQETALFILGQPRKYSNRTREE